MLTLCTAVMYQDVDLVKRLIALGAKRDKKNKFGESPLQMAQQMQLENKDKKSWEILRIVAGETQKDLSEVEVQEHETDQEKQTSKATVPDNSIIGIIGGFLSWFDWRQGTDDEDGDQK